MRSFSLAAIVVVTLFVVPLIASPQAQAQVTCRDDEAALLYHTLNGGSSHMQRRYQDAVDHLSCAIAAGPTPVEEGWLYFWRSAAFIEMDSNVAALADLNRAGNLLPDEALVYHHRGVVMLNLDRYADAQRSFLQALEIDPELPQAHANLGRLFTSLGQIEDGIAAWERARELGYRPIWRPYLAIGDALRSIERVDEALSAYEAAIDAAPDYGGSYLVLAELQEDLGMAAAADVTYRRYLNVVENPDPRIAERFAGVEDREDLLRYLPGIIIALIVAYFVLSGLWRWWRSGDEPPSWATHATGRNTS